MRMSGQEERRERRLSLTNFAPEVIVECRVMKSEMNRPCCAGGLEVACKKRRRRNLPCESSTILENEDCVKNEECVIACCPAPADSGSTPHTPPNQKARRHGWAEGPGGTHPWRG